MDGEIHYQNREICQKPIPNAINVPDETIGTDEIFQLPDKDQLIMVYCRSGRRSKEAAKKLVKLGYDKLIKRVFENVK